MSIEKEVELPWKPNDFLAITPDKKVISYSYSEKRAYEISAARGILPPWVIPASLYDSKKYELSDEIKEKIISQQQK